MNIIVWSVLGSFLFQTILPVNFSFASCSCNKASVSQQVRAKDSRFTSQFSDSSTNFYNHYPGDPVNLRNANFFLAFNDVISLHNPQPVKVTRNYNSRGTHNGHFGWGWSSFPADVRLVMDKKSGKMIDYNGVGGFSVFSPFGEGIFISKNNASIISIIKDTSEKGFLKESKNTGKWFYNASGYLVKHIDLTGNVLSINRSGAFINQIIDSRNKIWKFEYDKKKKINAIVRPDGQKSEYFYDNSNNLIKVNFPDGSFHSFSYDSYHNMISWYRPGIGTIKMKYNVEKDWIVAQSGPEKQVTKYQYEVDSNDSDLTRTIITDSKSNKITHIFKGIREHIIKYPDGSLYTERYDEDGNLLSITDALGNTESRKYDFLGRIIQKVNILGGVKTFSYADESSRIASIKNELGGTWLFSYNNGGNFSEIVNPNGYKTVYHYDERGLMESITNPEGRTVKMRYDDVGNMISLIEPSGKNSVLSYNKNGLLQKIVSYSGRIMNFDYDTSGRLLNQDGDVLNKIGFEYGKNGNISAVKGDEGYRLQYKYDSWGKIKTLQLPIDRTLKFKYDALGSLVNMEDVGVVTSVEYDKFKRIVKVESSGGDIIQFAYDVVGNVISIKNRNRNYTIIYHKNLVQEIKELKTGYFVRYGYDKAGNRIKMENSFGLKVDYKYDAGNRLTDINNVEAGRFDFAYNSNGSLANKTYPNGLEQSFIYDDTGRLTDTYFSRRDVDKNKKSPVAGYTYIYNLNNNLIRINEIDGNVSKFGYDNRSRLISADYPDGFREKFSYTQTGNRVIEGAEDAFIYNPAGQLLEDDRFFYKYGQSGVLKEKEDKNTSKKLRFDYNDFYQLTAVSEVKDSFGKERPLLSFGYDGFGRRISKTNIEGENNFYYDGLDLIAETDNEGRLKAQYIFGIGIDKPLAMLYGGEVYYFITDGLGNIRELQDRKGEAVNSYDYLAFGKISQKEEKIPNLFYYKAREFDNETGLYFNRARYYEPEAGIFTVMDPSSLLGGVSPYRYADWNPISYYDPLGLFGLDVTDPKFWGGTILGFIGGGIMLGGAVVAGGVILTIGGGSAIYSVATTDVQAQADKAIKANIKQYLQSQYVSQDPETKKVSIDYDIVGGLMDEKNLTRLKNQVKRYNEITCPGQ